MSRRLPKPHPMGIMGDLKDTLRNARHEQERPQKNLIEFEKWFAKVMMACLRADEETYHHFNPQDKDAAGPLFHEGNGSHLLGVRLRVEDVDFETILRVSASPGGDTLFNVEIVGSPRRHTMSKNAKEVTNAKNFAEDFGRAIKRHMIETPIQPGEQTVKLNDVPLEKKS